MSQSPITITEALLDPMWQANLIAIDGNLMIALSIDHPRHGMIHSVFTRQSVKNLRDWMTEALRALESQSAAPGQPPATEAPK